MPVPDRLSSRIVPSAGAAALVLLLAGCGSPPEQATTTPPSSTSAAAPATVVGTVVRFTSPNTSVDVTIGEDSPATRDLLSMLPLTIRLEEFAGREKIGDLPRELNHRGTPGSDPKDGDLIYFTPWGNLGFYYDTSGVGYSDQTLHIGTYDASREQLAQLQGDGVTVQIVDRS